MKKTNRKGWQKVDERWQALSQKTGLNIAVLKATETKPAEKIRGIRI